jgi:hypothetical protein
MKTRKQYEWLKEIDEVKDRKDEGVHVRMMVTVKIDT